MIEDGVHELCGIVTRVPRMVEVLRAIRLYAGTDAPVLIEGETGTGKELVAHALHQLGGRRAHPMVTIDCASLAESLAESELFGHERGAFTGAERQYGGRIDAANGGTLFLDEVNSISLAMQSKLLRFLETRQFCRVGARQPVKVDVRVIAATNAPLTRLVGDGRMRADFFHRLDVLRIDLPPLRERCDDISVLVRHFLAEDETARRFGISAVAEEVMAQLRARAWPGNVRELRNVVRRALVLHTDGVTLDQIDRAAADEPTTVLPCGAAPRRRGGLRAWLREREREYLTGLVERYHSTVDVAAASGLPERTLYRKLKSHGLQCGVARRWTAEVCSGNGTDGIS